MAIPTATGITITTRRGEAVSARPLFDSYLMVDWSAANTPRRGPDSIWLCHLVRRDDTLVATPPENLATRRAAHAMLRALLAAELEGDRSLLVGSGLSVSYPHALS